MKKLLIFFILIFALLLNSGCSTIKTDTNTDDIKITTTIFPYYDFIRSLTGYDSQVSMLLPLGAESHTYEPTPHDILEIADSDLFIYTGGKSDSWIDDIINSISDTDVKLLKLTDVFDPADSEHTYDEHIWTSPKNSIKIVNEIYTSLSEIDPENSENYKSNRDEYINRLTSLDDELTNVVSNAKRKTLVFADRFPFTHLANDYGLHCISAFSGCAEETEPSMKTISNIIKKVKDENIPTVFYIEFSNQKLADTIVRETGVNTALMHSCHNISKEEFENGITYIDLMHRNINEIKEALN